MVSERGRQREALVMGVVVCVLLATKVEDKFAYGRWTERRSPLSEVDKKTTQLSEVY